MSNIDLRNITNSFQDVRLISMASWPKAAEINPRDRNGPYMVTQEGYDPGDLTVTPDEFALGRSGKWLSLGHFFRMPVPERRAEFIFGTAAEVIQLMSNLPPKVEMLQRPAAAETAVTSTEGDEMAAAYKAGREKAAPATPPAGK